MIYCVVPEMFKDTSIFKYGRSTNVKERFRSYGDLEVIQVAEVNDPIKAERALHELAPIYFGKAVYHKEYYECDNRLKALEVFIEIAKAFPVERR
jgi:hypothetical protein